MDARIDQVNSLAREYVNSALRRVRHRRHEDDVTPICQFLQDEGRDEGLVKLGQDGFDRFVSTFFQ